MKYFRLPAVYPGWGVLSGVFICAALSLGLSSYIFGLFTVPVSEEFGISRADYNTGVIAFMVGTALISPLVGFLLDRFSARLIVLAGGLAFGAGLMLISRAHSLWVMLALLAVPVTFGVGACGALGANTIAVRWFQRRRGRALGFLAISTSIGGFASQPVTAFLIETFGWRDALFLLGAVAAVTFVLVALLLVRNRPKTSDHGYETEFSPDAGSTSDEQKLKESRVWTMGELLRSRNFWLFSIAIGLLFGVDQAVLVSQVPFFQDLGLDMKTAALLVSVKTLSAIGGKLIVGALADKVDLRILVAYVAGSNMLLLTIYSFEPSFWVLLASVALLGVAVGGVFPVWTTMLAWLFGPKSYGSAMGLMSIVVQIFAVVVMRFVGEVYDRAGSYVPAFLVFIAMVFTAVILCFLLRPHRDQRPTPANAELQ